MNKLFTFASSFFLIFILSGCAGTASESLNNLDGNQNSVVELSEAELKASMLDALRSDCDGINTYVLTPSNWETLSFDPISGGEFTLPGDGGSLTLAVIPDGAGGANVAIADADYETTNSALFYSGCSTLAVDPGGSTEVDSGSNAENESNGHYESRCTSERVANPQWDPNAAPGVMSMKGIPQFNFVQKCEQVWVNQ